MATRREFLQRALALVPASIIGRGFLNSKRVPETVQKLDLPIASLEGHRSLSDGWHLYESCGQSLFEVYGASGGLCCSFVAYLIRKMPVTRNVADLPFHDRLHLGRASGVYTDVAWEVIPLEFNDIELAAADYDEATVRNLINLKIEWALKNRKPRKFNPEGGDMGVLTREEREAERADLEGIITKRGLLGPPVNLELARHLTGVIPSLYGKG